MAIQRINTVAQVDYAQRLEASGTPTNVEAIEAQRDRQTIGMGVGLGLGLPLVVAGGVMALVGRHRRTEASRIALVPGGLAVRF
jgi:hypothetical protein